MINEQPLVSIIIPCYNAERFIKQTIDSVLNQSYQNFEIIVLNDGSTDNSLNIIQNILDERINIIDKKNTGVSDTRNIGFQKAKGKYILFLDSDDVISKNYLLSAIDFLENNQEYSFCTFFIKHIDENDNIIENIPNKRGTYQNIQEEIALFNTDVSTCPSAYIYKKDFLEKNYIFYSKILSSPADKYYLLCVSQYGKGKLIDLNTAYLLYRINQNSMSNKITEKLLLEQEYFYTETINNRLLSKNIEKIFSKKMAYQLISTFVKLKDYKKVLKYSLIYLKNL